MIKDVEFIEVECHVVKVRAHMTLLEEQQQEFEDLPNILGDMDVEEGKKIEKTVNPYYLRIPSSTCSTSTTKTSKRLKM